MRNASGKYTFFFIFFVCLITALSLSGVSLLLRPAQETAKKLFKSKQLLLAAQLVNSHSPAKTILDIYNRNVHLRYTNAQGTLTTTKTPLPVYVIAEKKTPQAYVFPINGFGLWDAIEGYLCVDKDGNTVIGTTWYNQKETPGLGGEIATESWQKQFYGKKIFQQTPDGKTDYAKAPLGIRVIKGQTVKPYEIPNTVDGISGASITSEGVAEAYRTSLMPYRAFLIRAHKGEIQLDG